MAQPTNSGQNTGLVVIVVGIFMVIIAFLAVTYLNSDTIKENQNRNSQKSQTERADLTQIVCGLWQADRDHGQVDKDLEKSIDAVCADARP